MSCCKVADLKASRPDLQDLFRLNNPTLELLLKMLGQGTTATDRTKKVLASEVRVLMKSFEEGDACGGAGGDAGGGAGGDNGGDAGDDNDDNDDHNDDNDENDGADMQIFVKMPTGKTITLYVEPTDTIDNVKSLIKNMEGIPRCLQRLTLEGLPVNDDDKVIRGATYELLMRLAGGGAKVKTTKFEKQMVLKSRATATNASLQPFTLNPALLLQASLTYTEMMAVEDIGYIQGLITQMSIADLERAVEGLGQLKMNEANLKKFAPLIIPNLDALQQTHTFLTGAIKTLESAFEFAFMHSYYDEEGCAYAYQNFLNNVHNALTEKRLEAAILQRHGIMVP